MLSVQPSLLCLRWDEQRGIPLVSRIHNPVVSCLASTHGAPQGLLVLCGNHVQMPFPSLAGTARELDWFCYIVLLLYHENIDQRRF